ncbi:hypothetical protein [Pseudomonas sp. 10S4]|uniref:hypothetical protein n=1 Tax=Pseudomonas sp. 10S4 TaxID=3048583 RepID=UPI002AC98B51|nr:MULTISPECIES: hypothetical protein [unclassified Pseudomonas]MEB0227281.1 hypothetical protein [Pseudomonas sp. 5S1]MEB0295956.1 hypothetical protein [Pseudomonas sp. 10S4]WPX20570.1 hypothetical protein RHM58_12090 [Pseudomonas sp. 10S4]
MGNKRKQSKPVVNTQDPTRAERAKLSKTSKIFAYIKAHPIAAVVVLAMPATPFVYQVVGDLSDGKWSGEATLYLHSEPLESNSPVYMFYASPTASESERIIVPVEVSVLNDSRKAAKSVNLSLRYVKATDRDKLPESAQTYSGSLGAADIMHDTNSSDSYVYSNYRIALMPPADKISFTDGAFAVPNYLRKDMPVYMSLGSGLDVKASLSSEMQSKHEWDIRYRGVVAKDNKGVGDWIKRDYGEYIAIELREKEGFWRYLWGWATATKVTVFSFSPKFRTDESHKIYVPIKNPEEYKGYRFSPYAKELIFGVN